MWNVLNYRVYGALWVNIKGSRWNFPSLFLGVKSSVWDCLRASIWFQLILRLNKYVVRIKRKEDKLSDIFKMLWECQAI